MHDPVSYCRLDSPGCTAIWEVSSTEAPLWRYWGPRLPEGTGPGPGLRDTRPLPSFTTDFDQPLSLFPGVGLGWFGQSAALAHRAGRDWASAITACTIEQPDDSCLVFTLDDAVTHQCICITARLDPESDVLSLRTSLTNKSEDCLDIQWLASGTVPLPPDAHTVRSFGGRHNAEFVPIEDSLTRSLWRRENRRGLTSHDVVPGAVVFCADGTAYGAQLAWSGNHAQQIDWIDDGRFQWQMGEWLAPGEVRLDAGETIETPEMLVTCSHEGANGVAWNFHRAIRARLSWPGGRMAARPVHLNTWEGFYFDHDEAALKDLASSAADLGIERFVLDDGWFQGRSDDHRALGDWWPDSAKYPKGLGPLAEHVTSLGMEFGLWVEPEMINPNSALFGAHPDWVLGIAGRPHITARNQLVLNMAHEGVADYLFDKIADLLATLPISYLKWDHNRDLTAAGAQALYRQHLLASYGLMARLRAAFPHVEIEACAGGGGRIDAGIVRYAHRFWTSDCIDAVSRVAIQRGFLQFMPPELMGAHVGASPAHSTGRQQSMAFRAGVALPGHFGVELDVRTLSEPERAELRTAIARYKAMRGQLHETRVWQGEGPDGLVWQAHGSNADVLLIVTRTSPTSLRYPPHIRLDMLNDGRCYSVERDGANAMQLYGAWIARMGIPLPNMRGEEVLVYRVRAL